MIDTLTAHSYLPNRGKRRFVFPTPGVTLDFNDVDPTLARDAWQALEADGATAETLQLYLRGVDADPIVETFHQGLMRCDQRLGRHTEAISVYCRSRQTLSVVLSVAPSSDSHTLYREIMQASAERAIMHRMCNAAGAIDEDHHDPAASGIPGASQAS